jgi:tetratricopeptide (TPR) repeat protein
MLGQVFVGRGESDKALQLVANADVDMAGDAPSQALAASVQAQAHAAMGDAAAAEAAARRALAFASLAPPPESVALLVARGAFSAGLRDDAEALVQKAMTIRGRAGTPGALARKVLGDAGIEPEAFAARAASARAGAPVVDEVVDPVAASPGRTDRGGRGSYMRARFPEGGRAVDDEAAAPGTAAANVERALAALHQARFDEAVLHVDHARAQLPDNPMVLMATVQVYLLRMRAQGFDAAAAAEVRRCLAAMDRQIPGEERVFAGLDVPVGVPAAG